MKTIWLAIITFVMFVMTVGMANAQDKEEGEESGLALPRMVSLRSNLINARSGPGARYPIEWVYQQKGAPVEITAEFELWRKIKDWEGSQTWVHKSMLSGTRTIKMTAKGESNIYASDDYQSRVVAKVEDQVIGQVKKCPSGSSFCLIKFDNIEGWVPRRNMFGVYADEVID